MPAYVLSPFKAPPALLIAGIPQYVFGSLNDKTGNTLGTVISNSAVTTTGTLTFLITSGNVPVVGALITVVGCANSANFNVTNATILSVSMATDGAGIQSGVCTVTYAITSTSQGTTTDVGIVSIPQVETLENLVNGASVPVAVPSAQLYNNQGKTINATVRFTGNPTTATASLQGAVEDRDPEYETLGVIANAGSPGNLGPTLEVTLAAYKFYRILISNVAGGVSPQVVAKITM
jgi:hypothetical protein